MAFLHTIESWHWLVVAFLLLGAETLGAGGFLLGSAASALLLAMIRWLGPNISWSWQLALFGAFSLVFTVAYWKLFKKINNRSDHPELNNRASQQVGRVLVLPQDLPHGQGRLQIGDTFWKVQAPRPLKKGTLVAVTGCDGMVLLIEESAP